MSKISLRHAPKNQPVAVLGAGPVGLAAAARLIERGIPFFILERAPVVGANLVDYGHVRLFSPWRYDVDPAMAALPAPAGWQSPDLEAIPLAIEVVERVLEPFARLPQLAGALHLNTRVDCITREGFDKVKSADRENAPFVIRAVRDGELIEFKARAVVDATNTWNRPNPLGAGGLPAIGEREASDRIFYGIPDVLGAARTRYAGKRTLVLGAGHSAANALLGLADLARQASGTTPVWSVRSPVPTRVFGGADADALPARGALGTSLCQLRDSGDVEFQAGLRITRIEARNGKLSVVGIKEDGREQRLDDIDEIICATGQRPDLSLTDELRVKLDPWLESNEALGPLIDPNLHSCGTVRPHGHRELGHPEPGLYTVGVKSYGRAPTFLMATGFGQVRSVVAAIAGDLDAADRVELDLPETGVCSVSGRQTTASATGVAVATHPPKRRSSMRRVAASRFGWNLLRDRVRGAAGVASGIRGYGKQADNPCRTERAMKGLSLQPIGKAMRSSATQSSAIQSTVTESTELHPAASQSTATGSLACVSEAWSAHEAELRGYLRHRLADEHAAEDLLQDVFVKAMCQGRAFCELDNPRAWLFQVARHAIIDRERGTRSLVTLDDIVHAIEAPIADSATPIDAMAGCVARVLSELAAEDAHILRACDLEGMTQREFAEREGLTLPAAKSRLLRARRRLRARLTIACQVSFDANGCVSSHVPRSGPTPSA